MDNPQATAAEVTAAEEHLPQRLEHARELKRELIDFAKNKRFDRWLAPVVARAATEPDRHKRDQLWVSALDEFVMTFRFPDGNGVIDRFLAARDDLDEHERALLAGWQDPVEGVFEVTARKDGRMTLLNLIDDQEYETRYLTAGLEAVVGTLNPGDFVLVRLVRLTQAPSEAPAETPPEAPPEAPDRTIWMISGTVNSSPKSASRKITKLALQLATEAPELAFTNPDLERRSWDAMRRDRERFIEFFGSDEVIFATGEVDNQINAFRLHAKKAVRAEAENGSTDIGSADIPADYFVPFSLPDGLKWAGKIGVLYGETSGMEYVVDYDKVKALFADPSLAADKEYTRLLQGYLKDDVVTPAPLERLVAAHPDTADEVFRRVLKRPDFTWAADGEALIRKRKPWFETEKRHPQIAVLGTRLRQLALG